MLVYIKQLRPKNWLKNVFVFTPLVFAIKLTDVTMLTDTVLAFAAFCLVSSAVYVFNDIRDVETDRKHPIKYKRPIASGKIGIKTAWTMSMLLFLAGMVVAFHVATLAGMLVMAYVLINLVYTLELKNRPVFDVFCIAAGFVLRVFVGGVTIVEGVSDWLFLTIVAMSLFMAFGKRRGEMLRVDRKNHRVVLKDYDLNFLNGMLFACAGLSIVFYSLWAMTRGLGMLYTVPIIIFIISKYLLLVHNIDSHGDPTTVILTDKTLFLACGIYVLTTVGLLYFGDAVRACITLTARFMTAIARPIFINPV